MPVDLTPQDLRQSWRNLGYYDGLDLYGAFRSQACQHPSRAAVLDESGEISYETLLASVHRIANLLVAAGVQTGDIVAVQLPNSWLSCAVDFAIAALGAVCLPFPSHYRRREVAQLLGKSRAVAYIVASEFGGHNHREMAIGLRDQLPDLRAVLFHGTDTVGGYSIVDALSGQTAGDWNPRSIDPASPCRVFVTSGTEAAPKMVLYSHEALGRPFHTMQVAMGVNADSRMFAGVPLGSGMGVQIGALLARHGATAVLTGAFKAGQALDIIEKHRPTHFYGVPTMVQMLLADPWFERTDTSSLQTIVSAGSSLPAHLARRLQEEHGWRSIAFYGCSDGASFNTGLDLSPERAAVVVGKADPRVSDLRVVGPDGTDKAAGAEGEIWARGPFSPWCYLNSPDLDAKYRDSDGWVKTGDLGVMDRDGYVSIVGRLKDIIIRGGFNISPVEIDDLLAGHPDIVHASCVGYEDERLGERVCAVLVLRDGAEMPTVQSLGEYLEGQGLSKYKLPERLLVLDKMPTNPVGKILKRTLREHVAQAVRT